MKDDNFPFSVPKRFIARIDIASHICIPYYLPIHCLCDVKSAICLKCNIATILTLYSSVLCSVPVHEKTNVVYIVTTSTCGVKV